MEWDSFQFSPARTCPSHSSVSARGVQQVIFGVSDGKHGLGAKVSIISLFQRMKCVGRKTILHYSKKCPSIIDERFCLEGVELTSCPVSFTGSWRRNGDLRVVPATCKGFLDLFTQI